MGRFLAGVAAAMLLMTGGLILWRSVSAADPGTVALPVASRGAAPADAPLADPPAASEKTREERRLGRYDKDRSGTVSRDEYLLARRKAFARLDKDGDGRLSFEEYAVKTGERFAKADADRSGVLDAAEFATTRVVRRTAARANCPPTRTAAAADDEES